MRPGKLFVFGPLDAFATVDHHERVLVWQVDAQGLAKLQPQVFTRAAWESLDQESRDALHQGWNTNPLAVHPEDPQ